MPTVPMVDESGSRYRTDRRECDESARMRADSLNSLCDKS